MAHVPEGPDNAETTLDLPGSRRVISAAITEQSAKHLVLTVGQPVTAAFKACSVFLVSAD